MRCRASMWISGSCLVLVLGWVQAQSQTSPRTNYTRPVFQCGGHFVTDSGFVGSEGFPSYYKPNSKCTWYITVPKGNVVMLSFGIFDLEANPLCRYDYMDVYNGHSYTMQKLGRFCGTSWPGVLMSTSNTMMVEMVSDLSMEGQGFVAYFNGAKPHVDENQFCGGRNTKPQGSLKTPNWPEKNYPAGISCSWHITVEPDMIIEVKFEKFDLEPHSYCRFDYVAFFNGGEKDDSRQIGKYCGDLLPGDIVTNGNELLVQFVSDHSVTSDGFMASYSSIPCGSREPTVEGDSKPCVKPPAPPRPAPSIHRNPTRAHIQSSFCNSEFVIMGKITAVSPGLRGSNNIHVSLKGAYKAGRLTITQAEEAMSGRLQFICKDCPSLDTGMNYILMGQVDEIGRGVLGPGSSIYPYSGSVRRHLTILRRDPC